MSVVTKTYKEMELLTCGSHLLVGTLSVLYDSVRGRWINKFRDIPDGEGRIAVITGGGRGIGVEIVKELVRSGMTVIVGVRNPKNTIQQQEDLASFKGKAVFLELDLSSLRSVEEFSKKVLQSYPKINLLINNAGVYVLPYSKTEDGYEIRFGTNYIGHFKLTHFLLEALKKGAEEKKNFSRVVTLSSCAHYMAKIHWEDLNMEHTTNMTNIYGQSKLAQHLFASYLNRILVNENIPIRSLSVHPGVVDSGMTTHYGILAPLLLKSQHEGAISVLHAALSPDLEGRGGLYLSNCENGAESSYAKDRENQERLWKWTLNELKVKEFGKES